jgi:hypothetical protein
MRDQSCVYLKNKKEGNMKQGKAGGENNFLNNILFTCN